MIFMNYEKLLPFLVAIYLLFSLYQTPKIQNKNELDILSIHPEFGKNNRIMNFVNYYKPDQIKEEIKGEYLYITIWNNEKPECPLTVIEDKSKNILQINSKIKCQVE